LSARGAAALLVTLWSLTVAAEDRRRVSIAVEGCGAVAEDVARIAAIELHATRAETGDDVTRIRVTCEGDAVALQVVDPLTSKRVARTVSVAGVEARARGRTIALAVAELVSASWVELETTPEPKVEPIPRRVRPPPAPARPPPRPRPRPRSRPRPRPPPPIVFQADASARVFFESRELLLGGGLAVEPWLGRSVLLRFDGFVEHATGSRSAGDVTIDTASTSAAIGIGTEGALRLTATLGARVGWARLAGREAITGAWAGPELGLGLELFPRAHVHPVFHFTLGWAVAGVDGPVPGDRDVLARGAYGGLAIGFGAN